MTGAGPDFPSWFDDVELEQCPSCGEQRLLPWSHRDAPRICIDCGVQPPPERTPQPAS